MHLSLGIYTQISKSETAGHNHKEWLNITTAERKNIQHQLKSFDKKEREKHRDLKKFENREGKQNLRVDSTALEKRHHLVMRLAHAITSERK